MTRTELIARHQYIADHDVNFETREIARATADMLEADAVNDDLTIAYMSGFNAGEDKYKAALRLALDALETNSNGCVDDDGCGYCSGCQAEKVITALKEVL